MFRRDIINYSVVINPFPAANQLNMCTYLFNDLNMIYTIYYYSQQMMIMQTIR